MSSDCQTPNRPYLLGVNSDLRKAVLFRPRCGMWACPTCAIKNRGRWAVRAYSGAKLLAQGGAEIDFLTLTSHRRLDPKGTMRVFAHAWDQLNKRVRRQVSGYAYLLIPEQHQDGRLHAHLIETCGLGTRWFKNNAAECGLGYMAEESKVHSPEGAAWYVSKYLSKNMVDTKWPENWRRIRTSRNWPPMPVLPAAEGWAWSVLKRNQALDETFDAYVTAGFEVAVLGSDTAWEYVGGRITLDGEIV